MSDVYVRLLLESEQYKRKLRDAEKQLDRFKKRGAGSLAAVTPKGLSSLAKGLGGIGAAVGAATTLQDIVRSSMELEKSLSSLGSLTGATAEDLKYFERTAIDLSTSTSQGAAEIVEAFKLIGGQRAELLDSREALVSVTRSAITLAEAAETDVPTAAKALTGALNQMGAGAEAADSYINAMAAGAQAGAGEIDYLMKAIEKSGGTASATGVAFNELVAAVEMLAPRITEAESAGTQLRNVLLKLEASSDRELRPSVNGLGGALEALAAKHYDAAQMAKVFGTENVNAALALTENLDAYRDMVEAVTGTNTAYEMAERNTDNLSGAVDRLKNSWDGFCLSLNQSNGLLKEAADWLAGLLNSASEALKSPEMQSKGRVDAGTTGQIQESYGLIQRNVEGGMDRRRAYTFEIERLRGLRDRAADVAEMRRHDREKALERNDNLNIFQRTWDTAGVVESNVALQQAEERVKSLNAAIAALEEQAATASTATGEEAERLKKLQEELKKGTQAGGTRAGGIARTEEHFAAGSLAAVQEELRGLNAKFDRAATDAERFTIRAQVVELEGQAASMKAAADFDAKMRDYRPAIEYRDTRDDLLAIRPETPDVAGSQAYKDLMADLGLDEATAKMRALGETMQEAFSPLTSGIVSAAMGAFNDLTGEGAGLWEKLLASILQSSFRLAMMTAMGDLFGQASAGGKGSGGGGTFFGGLLQTVVGGLIPGFGGFFANGGVIGGRDYGDGIVARVSSGEMVINQADQRRLLAAIKGGAGTGGGQVVFELRGSTLFGCIKNEMSKTGRTL